MAQDGLGKIEENRRFAVNVLIAFPLINFSDL